MAYQYSRAQSHQAQESFSSTLPLLNELKIYDLRTNALKLPHIILSGFEHHSNEISYKCSF